jgi:hypothetical protein
MTNPKEIAKSELGKIIFHLWQNKNHQRNESTLAMHNISWSEDFAESIIDALGLEFIDDDMESKLRDSFEKWLKSYYRLTPDKMPDLQGVNNMWSGDWHYTMYGTSLLFDAFKQGAKGKPVVNIKDIKDE